MWPDVINMKEFYATDLGQVARRMIRRRMRALFPHIKGSHFLGLGYVTPFIRYYREDAKRLVVVMPAEQGALSWSKKVPNVVTLADEYQLPLRDKCMDYVVIMHTLEFTRHGHEVLREAWRVLADGGKLLVVVPNRSGIWARMDHTPFGQGRPFSASQLKRLLNENLFTPDSVEHALYIPPFSSRVWLSFSKIWERIGYRWFKNMSGVLMVEASKTVYAALPEAEKNWIEELALGGKVALSKKNLSKGNVIKHTPNRP